MSGIFYQFLVFEVTFGYGNNNLKLAKSDLKTWVVLAERKFQIPSNLLDAVVKQESSYNILALNPNSNPGVAITSYGLGQLTQATATYHCNLTYTQIYQPVKNILCSAKVLSYQLNRYDGNIRLALSAYNAGTPCICDGSLFRQNLGGGNIRICTNFDTQEPLYCNQIGSIHNQEYVDGVLAKRREVFYRYLVDLGYTKIRLTTYTMWNNELCTQIFPCADKKIEVTKEMGDFLEKHIAGIF